MRFSTYKPFYYVSGAVSVITGGYLIRDYFTGSVPKPASEKLTGKVIIVTGSNTGIGKEVVRYLAQHDAKVIMACRDMAKCETTRRSIVIDTQNKYVYCRKCDLASQTSIREFADKFKKEFDRLDILVNNAAVMRCKKSYTKEGIELQLGVNHMGHFLLTNLLLDVLKNSAPSRIVNVSSSIHKSGTICLKDLNSDNDYDPTKAYAQSKLANLLFTMELANKLKGSGVTVNAVHPGIVKTELSRHMTVYQWAISRWIINGITWVFTKTPAKGAQAVLFVALDPSLKDVTGSYFVDNVVSPVSTEAMNDKIAKWLWLVSEKWTKLNNV